MDKKIRIELDQTQFKELILWTMDIPGYEDTLLWKVLNQKLSNLIDHELYAKSKTAPTPEERESARQQYLDRRHIPASFRW